jgi:hypothetical protein
MGDRDPGLRLSGFDILDSYLGKYKEQSHDNRKTSDFT